MSLPFANCLFDQIDGSVIAIGGDFVSYQVPDALLGIEFRMIRRQVFHLDFPMFGKKILNRLPPVPGRAVDIEVNLPSFDPVA